MKSHYGCQTYYKKTCTDVDTPESSTDECDDECEYSGDLMYGGSDSCRNRVDWILSAGQPVQLAYEIVNEACAGQCFCSPPGSSTTESPAPSASLSPLPTPAPASAATPAPTAASTPA